MNIGRRDFLKATAMTFLAASSVSGKVIKDSFVNQAHWGSKTKEIWDLTTLHHKLILQLSSVDRMLRFPFLGNKGMGENFTLRNELSKNNMPANNPESLLFFGSITDSNILDEESPARDIAAATYL